jgi:ribosome assembly protein SQT1
MWFIPNGGQVMNVFTGHSAAVTCGQFSPDGKHLVTGDSDGTLIMWDPKVPTPAWRLSSSVGDARWHQSGALTCLSVSADGQLILTGGEDGACKLIQLQSGKFIGSLNGHSDAVEAVAFCPSLPLVVSGSIDGMVLVWDLQTLKQRTALQHQVQLLIATYTNIH